MIKGTCSLERPCLCGTVLAYTVFMSCACLFACPFEVGGLIFESMTAAFLENMGGDAVVSAAGLDTSSSSGRGALRNVEPERAQGEVDVPP